MSWEKYEVMSEFLKIASENGMIKEALPEKNPHQEDLKTIEQKRLKPAKKNIIEVAHPEPVYVAEAKGDGGLVENQVEQQNKIIQMINKMPTGSLIGRYAQATTTLVKLAADFDDVGEFEMANMLTDVAGKLTSEMSSIMENTRKLINDVDSANSAADKMLEDLSPFVEAPRK